MSCEYIPIYIDHPLIRDDPDIVVPIKYLVEEIKIQQYHVYFKIIKRDQLLN